MVISCINSLQRHVDVTHSTHNECGNVHSHADAALISCYKLRDTLIKTYTHIFSVLSGIRDSLASDSNQTHRLKHCWHNLNTYLCTAATPSSV